MGQPSEHDSPQPRDRHIGEMAAAFADALLSADASTAEVVLREAMDAGLTSAAIDEKLIAPALWLVGEMWERGEISVDEEHLATEIATRVLALQREARRVVRSRPEHRILLATAPGERHLVALRMVENLLLDAGYDVLMLGADVPGWTLGDAAGRHDVDVVCMSSTMLGRCTETVRVIDEVRERRPDVRFVIGGRGVTVEGQLRHGVDVCGRVSDAVEAVDAALQRAANN